MRMYSDGRLRTANRGISMSPDTIQRAARRLIGARTGGDLIEELDADLRPVTVAEAHAIQDATVALLGESVSGWKVTTSPEGEFVRGVVLASRVFDSPACVPAALVPMLAVEVEIAFRFDHDLPARARPYDAAEIAGAVTPFAAIEVVDSRFRRYADTPVLHRMADCVSNGAFVAGSGPRDWRGLDLSALEVSLAVEGEVIVRRVGGHPTVDPMLPVVALVNNFRAIDGVRAGQFVTTGTFTGLTRVRAGESVAGSFAGFGSVQLTFV
ncbi:2-keto-4-pentenoate hydratase [Paraburkholderia sp. BL8N3]|nr:2-keto-4-pentenoate hydratase [Paraburkholderia sp. BL8N3]